MGGAIGGRAGVRWLLAASAGFPLAGPAFAGAWSQSEKTTQTIVTVSRALIDQGEMWRSETFSETGFGGGWATSFKLETEQRFADTNEDRAAWRVGLQKSFGLGERASASVLVSYIGGDSLDGPYCEGDGVETRGAVGTSFLVLGREAYVDAGAGWRARETEGCDRALAELAFGMEVAPNLTLSLKSWAEEGGEGHSAKLEAGLMYDFGPVAIGAGWREEVSGAFEEKGWLVSAWRTF